MGVSTSASYSKREAVPYARLVHCMVCTNRNPGVSFSKGGSKPASSISAAQTGDESVVVAVLPRYDMALTDLFARTGPLATALCTIITSQEARPMTDDSSKAFQTYRC